MGPSLKTAGNLKTETGKPLTYVSTGTACVKIDGDVNAKKVSEGALTGTTEYNEATPKSADPVPVQEKDALAQRRAREAYERKVVKSATSVSSAGQAIPTGTEVKLPEVSSDITGTLTRIKEQKAVADPTQAVGSDELDYRVARGDTGLGISGKVLGTVEGFSDLKQGQQTELKKMYWKDVGEANPLIEQSSPEGLDRIYAGEQIDLPSVGQDITAKAAEFKKANETSTATSSAEKKPEALQTPEAEKDYKIKSGDTLNKIASTALQQDAGLKFKDRDKVTQQRMTESYAQAIAKQNTIKDANVIQADAKISLPAVPDAVATIALESKARQVISQSPELKEKWAKLSEDQRTMVAAAKAQAVVKTVDEKDPRGVLAKADAGSDKTVKDALSDAGYGNDESFGSTLEFALAGYSSSDAKRIADLLEGDEFTDPMKASTTVGFWLYKQKEYKDEYLKANIPGALEKLSQIKAKGILPDDGK
jgi:hypothetical protein